jgi:serine/threonine-protein kinase HipA
MADRHAVIWTEAERGPVKMGNLVVTAREARFSYEADYRLTSLPGLSLALPVSTFTTNTYTHSIDVLFPLPPRLMAYLPGLSPDNLQRRIYTALLRDRRFPPDDPFSMDWEILMLSGRDGIGHFDVFRNDQDALQHYRAPHTERQAITTRSSIWGYFKSAIGEALSLEEAQIIAASLGATPSAEGMIPKLLVSIPDGPKWDGRIAAPGARQISGEKFIDVLLKFEPRAYPGVSHLESLCLDLHAEMNIPTPRHWVHHHDGLTVLAVERIDRQDGMRLPMETIASIFATAGRISRPSDISMEELGSNLLGLKDLGVNPKPIRRDLFRRWIISLYTGNGDMHLKNMSILGSGENAALSPVYDPAPMRAYHHESRSALPFDPEHKAGLRAAIIRLGYNHFGLTRQDASGMLDSVEHATSGYLDRVDSLDIVDVAVRQRLNTRVRDVRNALAGRS